ncbi:glycosyltransferase, partial [Gammaproteobacteria bacterium]|nr:glycosyltransferase [Gammaproteobacteria bacterium]
MSSEEKFRFNLSVVMVNYRTPNLVTDCLESLLPELHGVDSRVVIVDNNSGDNSFGIIQKWLTQNDTQNQCL